MDKKKVKKIAREEAEEIATRVARREINDQKTHEQFWSIITGNDFQTRVVRIVRESLGSRIPDEVATYLAAHLTGLVKDLVLEQLDKSLRERVNPLVNAEMLETLSRQSGVSELLVEHKTHVQKSLEDSLRAFGEQKAAHLTDLRIVTRDEHTSFRFQAQETAQAIVRDLISTDSTDGFVLKAFKSELKIQNDANFERLREFHKEELEKAHANTNWWFSVMGSALGVCIAYIAYMKA